MVRSFRLVGLVLALLIVATPLLGCSDKDKMESFALPMGYVANVQFAPWYLAKERGYFRAAGYDVTFDYRWETDGIQLVAAGEIPFTIASGDQVIQARSQGLPVVAVAAWYQTFPVAIVALPDVPLDSPEDLRGLRIGIPETFGASYIGLRALLSKGGLTEDDIDLQPIGYTQLAALTNDTVDAVVVYANNEPVVMAQQGLAYNILYVAEYANIVSAVVVSSDDYVKRNPEKVTAFVRAFLTGLRETIRDHAAAFEFCRPYVEGLGDNSGTQWAVLKSSIDLWQAQALGWFTPERWEEAQQVMVDAGLIETMVPVEDLYSNDYISAER